MIKSTIAALVLVGLSASPVMAQDQNAQTSSEVATEEAAAGYSTTAVTATVVGSIAQWWCIKHRPWLSHHRQCDPGRPRYYCLMVERQAGHHLE